MKTFYQYLFLYKSAFISITISFNPFYIRLHNRTTGKRIKLLKGKK